MPRIPIVMPQLGESIAEATIVSLNITVGEAVECDQDVLEEKPKKRSWGSPHLAQVLSRNGLQN